MTDNAAASVAVIFSSLPIANPASQPAFSKFVLRKAGETFVQQPSKIYMPLDAQGSSLGVAIVRYETDGDAQRAMNRLHGTAIDMNHTWTVERVDVSQVLADLDARGLVDWGRVDGLRGVIEEV